MTPRTVSEEDRPTFQALAAARAGAVEHYTKAIEYSRRRRDLITELMDAGYSQSDIARELGVTRQAVQKMIAIHRDRGLVSRLKPDGE